MENKKCRKTFATPGMSHLENLGEIFSINITKEQKKTRNQT